MLPNGFEYCEAEMGKTVPLPVDAPRYFQMHHTDTYAQLDAFDWSNG